MNTIKETMAIMGIITSLLAACAGERPQNLGIRDGRLSPCPDRPNCVSSQGIDQKHFIAPLVVTGDPQHSFEDSENRFHRAGPLTVDDLARRRPEFGGART